MTVHFIGAGPGDPELITVRGQRLIGQCPVCLYAGSLVPPAIIEAAPAGARIIDTAGLTLDAIIDALAEAHREGLDVARVQSGDPSLYGAIAEQIRRLEALGIPYDITPGVPAYAAAAARLGRELTVPGLAQTVILTRTAMKATAMPGGEDLETLGRSGATLAIHLSIRNIPHIQATLTPLYGADCPVVVAYRVGWPDEQFLHGTLATFHQAVRAARITRTALILVGRALEPAEFMDSALYDRDHAHLCRPVACDDDGPTDPRDAVLAGDSASPLNHSGHPREGGDQENQPSGLDPRLRGDDERGASRVAMPQDPPEPICDSSGSSGERA